MPDIFGLGTPVVVVNAGGGGREEPPVGVADGSQKGAQQQTSGEPGPAVDRNPRATAPEASPTALTLSTGGHVVVQVFTVAGRKVRTLVNQEMLAGRHDLAWDGKDESGRRVPSGVYFYQIEAPGLRQVKRIVITR